MLSRTLLADLPELGRLSRREIAKLVGIAPLSRDSGTFRGRRFVQGARAAVRGALYIGAPVAVRYNPVIRAFYTSAGRRGKAVEAGARGLHAKAAHASPRHGPYEVAVDGRIRSTCSRV